MIDDDDDDDDYDHMIIVTMAMLPTVMVRMLMLIEMCIVSHGRCAQCMHMNTQSTTGTMHNNWR